MEGYLVTDSTEFQDFWSSIKEIIVLSKSWYSLFSTQLPRQFLYWWSTLVWLVREWILTSVVVTLLASFMNLFLFFVYVCVGKSKNLLYNLKCWRQSSKNLPHTKGNEIFRCGVSLLLCCSVHCFHQLAGESLQSKAGQEFFGNFQYRAFPCASNESPPWLI